MAHLDTEQAKKKKTKHKKPSKHHTQNPKAQASQHFHFIAVALQKTNACTKVREYD